MLWFHSRIPCEVARTGKFTETGSRLSLAGAEEAELMFDAYKVFIWEDEKALWR